MRYRWKAAFALISVLALVGAACGGGEKKATTPKATGALAGTTITFSSSLAQSELGSLPDVLSLFKEQTGVSVKTTQVTAQDLPQKLQVEVSSNNHTIHLIAQDNLALAVLVDKDLVEDLSDVQIADGVLPSMIPEKFDGKQYFLPFRPNVRVTYVNRDRFQAAGVQPPTTTDEYKTVAEKLKAAAGGQGKVTLSLADQPDTGPLGVTMSEWIVSFGGNPVILNDVGRLPPLSWPRRASSKSSMSMRGGKVLPGRLTSWVGTSWASPRASPASRRKRLSLWPNS